jgi:hypothetical protein
MSEPFDAMDVSHRSGRYLIATSVCNCRHCGGTTRVVALCLPPGHEIFDAEDGSWNEAPSFALLFQVEWIPVAVQRRLSELAPGYGPDGNEVPVRVNHCEICARPIGDDELFCEPGGAFLPTSEAAAGHIRLTRVAEGITVSAGGYAEEPAFFPVMGRD